MAAAPRIGFFSSFVPPEWLAAWGALAVRLRPGTIGPNVPFLPGMCPYARCALEAASGLDLDGIVFTTTCDQMRRTAEMASARAGRRTFVMNVPATWQTAHAVRLYTGELERVGRFVTSLGGHAPTPVDLETEMLRHDDLRQRLRACLATHDSAEVARACGSTDLARAVQLCESLPLRTETALPVALIGGPLAECDLFVYSLIRKSGGSVVLDGTEGGTRTMPARFDRRRLRDSPLRELTDAYFGSIPGAFRRPDDLLYSWVTREVRASGARGVILVRYVWCDLWTAHAERLADATGLPVLEVDLSDDASQERRIAGRIDAFLEILA